MYPVTAVPERVWRRLSAVPIRLSFLNSKTQPISIFQTSLAIIRMVGIGRGVSIALPCCTFGAGETCYRNNPFQHLALLELWTYHNDSPPQRMRGFPTGAHLRVAVACIWRQCSMKGEAMRPEITEKACGRPISHMGADCGSDTVITESGRFGGIATAVASACSVFQFGPAATPGASFSGSSSRM